MKLLKKLDLYILKNFVPLLMVTLPVCWFIVLMQFLYRYIDELVGKGLSMIIIAKIIFYAAMTFLPMALPLGILLASLMTFGNFGEKLELLSMKASGISLFRIMRPLFLFVCFLSVSLFIFENDFMIRSQVKLWTLLYSAKRTAPELEIPEGSFYNAISGYNVYVNKRDRKTGMLKDIILYDYSQGIYNPRIIRADSGRLLMNDNKNFLKWKLYSGQSFENIQKNTYNYYGEDPISHIKERFKYKEVLIAFDASFQKQDESAMQSMFVGKNFNELTDAIKESRIQIDSVRNDNIASIKQISYVNSFSSDMPSPSDTIADNVLKRNRIEALADKPILTDSIFKITSFQDSLYVYSTASANMQRMFNEITSREYNEDSYFYTYRTNVQERHRKFTFPVACIIFFLIGAPLGAIIRKGGIGIPMISSIFLFIVYYVIDTMGYKLSNSQSIPLWFGAWLSSLALAPLCVYLTITATRDSTSLNIDAWVIYIKKMFGINRVRNIEYREVIINQSSSSHLAVLAKELKGDFQKLDVYLKLKNVMDCWKHGSNNEFVSDLNNRFEMFVEEASNSSDVLFVSKIKDLPYMHQKASLLLPQNKMFANILFFILPLSVPITIVEILYRNKMKKNIDNIINILEQCISLLSNKN